ncbi:MAG: hypothetical protein LBK60_03660 [Verrucomicrobiales bacterium]|nr:hypothetical protein [Verrucomicrobiales bacterium]
MDTITVWWDGLDWSAQIFYGVGLLALFAVFIQVALTLFGVGDGDEAGGGWDADGDAAGHSTGSFLSFRGLTAQALGFGWGGAIGLKLGLTPLWAAAAGIVAGLALGFLFLWMMRQLARLQSDGTFKLESAVGGVGTVYLTVPPQGEGTGEVVVKAAGRAVHCKAYNDAPTVIKSGDEVNIKALQGTGVLVTPLNRS